MSDGRELHHHELSIFIPVRVGRDQLGALTADGDCGGGWKRDAALRDRSLYMMLPGVEAALIHPDAGREGLICLRREIGEQERFYLRRGGRVIPAVPGDPVAYFFGNGIGVVAFPWSVRPVVRRWQPGRRSVDSRLLRSTATEVILEWDGSEHAIGVDQIPRGSLERAAQVAAGSMGLIELVHGTPTSWRLLDAARKLTLPIRHDISPEVLFHCVREGKESAWIAEDGVPLRNAPEDLAAFLELWKSGPADRAPRVAATYITDANGVRALASAECRIAPGVEDAIDAGYLMTRAGMDSGEKRIGRWDDAAGKAEWMRLGDVITAMALDPLRVCFPKLDILPALQDRIPGFALMGASGSDTEDPVWKTFLVGCASDQHPDPELEIVTLSEQVRMSSDFGITTILGLAGPHTREADAHFVREGLAAGFRDHYRFLYALVFFQWLSLSRVRAAAAAIDFLGRNYSPEIVHEMRAVKGFFVDYLACGEQPSISPLRQKERAYQTMRLALRIEATCAETARLVDTVQDELEGYFADLTKQSHDNESRALSRRELQERIAIQRWGTLAGILSGFLLLTTLWLGILGLNVQETNTGTPSVFALTLPAHQGWPTILTLIGFSFSGLVMFSLVRVLMMAAKVKELRRQIEEVGGGA